MISPEMQVFKLTVSPDLKQSDDFLLKMHRLMHKLYLETILLFTDVNVNFHSKGKRP